MRYGFQILPYSPAEWYVLKRPLYRPNTSYRRVAKYVLAFTLANLVLAYLLRYLFDYIAMSMAIPSVLVSLQVQHRTAFYALILLCCLCTTGSLVCKQAIIGGIHLYQRYAPEHIRRRCLFKPTCSEYAILAIEKYGVIVGVRKAYIRLFKRCHGMIYRIDEP